MQGFEEAQSEFLAFDAAGYAGQVRRFGPYGPAYDVISVQRNGELEIEVVESSERLMYPLADFLADPIALTVP
jgi:hypothetical protein